MFSKDELKQYNRHLILEKIGKEGQLKLKSSKVIVIGAGGLGCPILQYLTAAGVGTIGIIDYDVVNQSNLQRQILYTFDDIGKPKAESAMKRLSRLNPFIKFNVYNERLTNKNILSIFENYDIIIDGSDNFPTRYMINDAVVLLNKPLVYGAIFKFEGQVSVFNYKGAATYRCLYPKPPKIQESPNCSEIGVLGVLPGIIGSFQANEVIKIICEMGEVLTNKLLILDVLNMRQILLKFERTKNTKLISLEKDYENFCGLKNMENEISLDELENNREKYNLLDVREDWERKESHIGGQHISLLDLPIRYKEITPEKPLVVYCKSGKRSRTAISILKDKKIKGLKLLNLKGGVN